MKKICYILLTLYSAMIYAQKNSSLNNIQPLQQQTAGLTQQAIKNNLSGSPDPSMEADLFTVSFTYNETTYKNSLGDTYHFETKVSGNGTVIGGKILLQ